MCPASFIQYYVLLFCIVRMYTSVFTHLTVNGYLGSFQFEAMLVGVITLKKKKESDLHIHTVESISRSKIAGP